MPTFLGEYLGVGKRLLSKGSGAMLLGARNRGLDRMGMLMRANARAQGTMIGRGILNPGLRGAGIGAGLNMAQYGVFGDRSGRGRSFGGFMGAGVRGAMAGGAVGMGMGAGNVLMNPRSQAWGAFARGDF